MFKRLVVVAVVAVLVAGCVSTAPVRREPKPVPVYHKLTWSVCIPEGLTASAYLYGGDDPGWRIYVKNRSQVPIWTNYFTDSFNLLTADGTEYNLRIDSILDYPASPINPGEEVTYRFKPERTSYPSKIAFIECKLGSTRRTYWIDICATEEEARVYGQLLQFAIDTL